MNIKKLIKKMPDVIYTNNFIEAKMKNNYGKTS